MIECFNCLQVLKRETRACKGVWKNYVCCTCRKGYKNQRNLIKHIRDECGVEPQYNCAHCGYRAKQKVNLKKHLALKHPTSL